ncbi:MAG: tRNA (adenosine(37)-N6)-dimethylallyltransferase MiaA [Acholeplasma sp.]|nr:tRNA (adenosine(37)-N6)-dimethylallyltransferase MiaA [Acholeplasma sp.]
MKKVVVICGPTAVGKTGLSIELAKKFNAEIISGDSVQVYKGLDIGSAKIKPIETKGVRHHLIDVYEPNQLYDVSTFQKEVRQLIHTIDHPFIVGGTGLYIKAALFNYEFDSPKRDIDLEKALSEWTNEALYKRLVSLDEQASKQIHPNNRRRVLRAISMAQHQKRSSLNKKDELLYDAYIIYLSMPRETLYERINQRVDIMLDDGFLQEVKTLKKRGITPNILGYRELNQYIDGQITLDEAIALIKQNTRHLAKRQETWFKNQMHAHVYDVSDKKDVLDQLIKDIKAFYED